MQQASKTDSLPELKNYEIIARIGQGGVAEIYKARQKSLNRFVAIKFLFHELTTDPDIVRRFDREAETIAALNHPHIVHVIDKGLVDGRYYFVMEYVDGAPFRDIIYSDEYKLWDKLEIIVMVLKALDYAHKNGVIHRDIKPANLMVLSDYTIKVMDFGIARVDSSSMTRTGVAMGTPNYISPEQLQGKPVDHRTDIFSLGVVMYEMLVGRRPFRGENLTSLIYNIVNTEPEAPSSIDKSVPNILDRVIARALKKNPEERYQEAGEIVTGLADFMETFSAKRSASV